MDGDIEYSCRVRVPYLQWSETLNVTSSTPSAVKGKLADQYVHVYVCSVIILITFDLYSCGKVTTNTEKIYDFALQLPKRWVNALIVS